ncbi:Peptidase C48, SUMO/Sentrin/Ubl1 [Artemisia annua]|uniref:Peptidase C48, SUMO/Sentrin/Ubl1 n=1 Tax=Artemisia annua TaxID=35608 RepID=A0A2U1NJ59_ARTAN|nr:Peptidase C48, SUMO/Sentrin/Ubl1 [Artemisia annua]
MAKQEMEANPDKKTEKLGHRRPGNGKGENMDNDFVSDKETEQGGGLKNVEAHRKRRLKGMRNFVDCGAYAMRHMETYMGGGEYDDRCGLRRECKEKKLQLTVLR